MATSYKNITGKDITQTATKLHEAIPLTGSIISGTYSDNNIKTYGHGMFESVYDYPYLSSSANHILDITAGFSAGSALSGAAGVVAQESKIDIYNEVAQMLAGYDSTGSINRFDVSGTFTGGTAADKMDEVFILNFARLLTKDEIQKEADGFQLEVAVTGAYFSASHNYSHNNLKIYDKFGTANYRTNSPAGDYNLLYASSSFPFATSARTERPCGLIFYQAGIAVLTASVFTTAFVSSSEMDTSGRTVDQLLVAGTIDANCDALRHRVHNISFNNTTELNSTIYFCRANNSEFNYSSNPTYLTASQIRVKNVASDNPVSYITTVGLYSQDNALLAVAKLSEPLKKTPANEYTLRVRLDY
jgi:hypothetical protein